MVRGWIGDTQRHRKAAKEGWLLRKYRLAQARAFSRGTGEGARTRMWMKT